MSLPIETVKRLLPGKGWSLGAVKLIIEKAVKFIQIEGDAARARAEAAGRKTVQAEDVISIPKASSIKLNPAHRANRMLNLKLAQANARLKKNGLQPVTITKEDVFEG